MRRSVLTRLAATSTLVCVLALAPSARGQAFDSDPQNPDNWVVSTILEGRELGNRQEYSWDFGVRSTFSAAWKRVWGSTFWTRNDVPMGGGCSYYSVHSVDR